MCNAFSCLVLPDKKVIWKFGEDSHEDLIQVGHLKDDTLDKAKMAFARCEISPNNHNYLKPDRWFFNLDERIKPLWFTSKHKASCHKAFLSWKKELDKILIYKDIVHPFKVKPPSVIDKTHLDLLRQWGSVGYSVGYSVGNSVGYSVGNSVGNSVGDSVRNSVRNSVWDSVGYSVGNSVGDSVRNSVRNSVWDSVGYSVRNSVRNSVWDSVGAYTGSFFNLDRKSWKYTEKIKTRDYPFQPAVDLWNIGLVASFDGKIWRLHGSKEAKIFWEGSISNLYKE